MHINGKVKAIYPSSVFFDDGNFFFQIRVVGGRGVYTIKSEMSFPTENHARQAMRETVFRLRQKHGV